MSAHDDLAELWRWFVVNEAAAYSPLYAAIAGAAAGDDDILGLVASAPPMSQYPLMTLAAVHDLVLAGEVPELAAVYRGERPVEVAFPLFRAAVLDHRDRVLAMLHTRFIQTNECGRAAPLALGIAAAARAVGEIDALVDAGASAGLNLLYDRYRLEVGDLGVWGDADSPVVCSCAIGGHAPERLQLVDVPARIGLDRAPIDVTDESAARWLLACTWPDTGRLERTRAAIKIAAADPPDVRTGDLVCDLAPLLRGVEGDGPLCVVTSWTLGYLDGSERAAFVAALGAVAAARTIAWLSFEHPGVVRGIDADVAPRTKFSTVRSVVGLTILGPSRTTSQRAMAHVHPHGSSLEWIAAIPSFCSGENGVQL